MAHEPDAHHEPGDVSKQKRKWRKEIWRKISWQNYGLSLIFIGIVPLLPIVIELFVRGDVAESSLFITAAIYSIAIGLASNNRFYFGFFLVASILESAVYGAVANGVITHPVTGRIIGIKIVSNSSSGLSDCKALFVAILIPFGSLMVERFSRHILIREEFFEFLKGKEA